MAQISLFFVLLLATQVWAVPKISAYRKPGVSYLEYFPKSVQSLGSGVAPEASASEAAIEWTKLDTKSMKPWPSLTVLEEAFQKVRDSRFLVTRDMPDFKRRSSWLYPADGCFARAGLANKNLIDWNYPEAYKVFVFGDLNVKTDNSTSGQVTWWFHVVPAVKVGEEVYILDPAIEPQKPLLLKEWLERMTLDLTSVKVSVCHPKTYSPYDTCAVEPNAVLGDWGHGDQMSYLEAEWENLIWLKRDPKEELGDNPPWSVKP